MNEINDLKVVIGQLQREVLNLRMQLASKVDKGKLIGQINISSEGILIDGKKLHITGETLIDKHKN